MNYKTNYLTWLFYPTIVGEDFLTGYNFLFGALFSLFTFSSTEGVCFVCEPLAYLAH